MKTPEELARRHRVRSISVDDATWKAVTEAAQAEGISRQKWIRRAFTTALEAQRKGDD